MKILQIIDSLAMGGAEKLIVETVPLLVNRGFQVDVVLLNGEKTHLYEDLKSLNCCTIYSLGKSVYNPFHIIKLIPFFYRYKIVHVHLFPAQYFAAIAQLFTFKKNQFFFTEHNTSNKRLENSKYRWIEKLIYSRYKNVICITNEVKQVLVNKLNLSPSKLVVVQNGINIDNINKSKVSSRVNFGFTSDDKLLIMVAAFRQQKDHETVIECLSGLPSQYKLVFVGDGEKRDTIESIISQKNLSDRIVLLGLRTDVYELIKMSDIAILSSHWEGFGLAAAEAMACGIPTIASNVDGLAQVVSGGGILFEKGNVNDLRDRILELENKIYYSAVKENCLNKASEFDISKMIDKLIVIYRDLCKK